jgi:hypothetical protein
VEIAENTVRMDSRDHTRKSSLTVTNKDFSGKSWPKMYWRIREGIKF